MYYTVSKADSLDPSGGSGIGGAIKRSVYYSLIKDFSGGLLYVEGSF